MIEEFLNQIDFNELATFAGSVVNVVLHGLIIAVIAAIPITITVLIMYAVEKIRGKQDEICFTAWCPDIRHCS